MSVFTRRFGFDPGEEVLLEIESVNILDLDPPASISGIGTGTVICVGEFENGPFAATEGTAEMRKGTYEVAGATDYVGKAGALGYTYDGVAAQNPCARKRSADGALTAETWNGNGFVQLSGKKFRRLLICRVDTSVGSVQFTRQAFLTGAAEFAYNLEPGQTLVTNDAGTLRTATFTATAAVRTSSAGTYPGTIVGGETLVVAYDDKPAITVTFLAGDTSQANMISRINLAFGFTFAADAGAGVTTLTGLKRGTGGKVQIVSGTAAVLTAMGLTANTVVGTGNVSNIDAVTYQEIKAVVDAAYSAGSITVSKDSNGALRLNKAYTSAHDWMTVSSTSTADALGFVEGQHVSNSGYAYVRSTAGSYPTAFAGGETLTVGFDDQPDLTVIFGADTAQAAVISRINQFAGYEMARAISGTVIELRGNANGGQMRVVSGSSGVFTALGLSATTAIAETQSSGKIPAGTVVQTSDGTKKFTTMQDVAVTVAANTQRPSGVGPYPVKIRHAKDDGTGASSLAGTINTTERAIDLASFKVENIANVNSALSEAAIDAAYADAINSTADINSVTREANVIFSARQSNAVRSTLRSNVRTASSTGSFGRMACVRPPLNTAKDVATSGSAAPGVGATRDQRVIYCYPGFNTFVPMIARLGLTGGDGFTADGNVDVGSDGFMASICSQLPPEENPGQLTAFTDAVNGIESGANVQGFQMEDYITFRAKGIAGARMDDGVAIFQSGVTSVDPSVFPQLRNIARRRMADFIQDSLARRGKAFGKKLSTFVRRKAFANEVRQFLESLLSRNNTASQRIAGYTVDSKSGNTQRTLALGIYRLIIKVRTLASLDSIVLETTIGESVEVEEQLPEAA
jgi:hypothetical protein